MAGAAEAAVWHERATAGWGALAAQAFAPRRRGVVVHEPRRRRAVALWPFSQVLHAAASLGAPQRPGLRTGLERYRRGPGYAERPHARRRYYDDNAWIGLALLAQGDAETALRVLGFLREACVPLSRGAVGVRWVEGGDALHACSTGSVGLLACRLAVIAPAGLAAPHLALARGCAAFLASLLDGDGLVADHRRPDGTVDPAVFSYNQGLLVGLLRGLDRVDEAVDLACRVRDLFGPDRLWSHPAAFNAILVRELLGLDAVRPEARLREWCSAYLDRVWIEARDPATGLLTGGGIGRYDDGTVLDHAALTGAMAELAAATR